MSYYRLLLVLLLSEMCGCHCCFCCCCRSYHLTYQFVCLCWNKHFPCVPCRKWSLPRTQIR